MINFKEELIKYQPLLEIEEIHKTLQPSSMKDLIEVIETIAMKSCDNDGLISENKIKENVNNSNNSNNSKNTKENTKESTKENSNENTKDENKESSKNENIKNEEQVGKRYE